MSWRIRRSIRLLPGLRLNVSKSGFSVSAGRRGAHVTVGHGKVRTTVGLPGSGISYTKTTPITASSKRPAVRGQASPGGCLQVLFGIIGFIVIIMLLAALFS